MFVVSAEGGTATRLRANDPPACTGLTSPGLTNSWARWAPTAEASGDLRYYWLVFSSKRRPADSVGSGGPLIPQLYIAAVVTSTAGGAKEYEKETTRVDCGSDSAVKASPSSQTVLRDPTLVPPLPFLRDALIGETTIPQGPHR